MTRGVLLPTNMERGQVMVGGFLKDKMMLDGFGRRSPTSRLPIGQRRWREKLADLWGRELGRIDVRTQSDKGALYRHNFVLSLSGEETDKLTNAGVSAPAVYGKSSRENLAALS